MLPMAGTNMRRTGAMERAIALFVLAVFILGITGYPGLHKELLVHSYLPIRVYKVVTNCRNSAPEAPHTTMIHTPAGSFR